MRKMVYAITSVLKFDRLTQTWSEVAAMPKGRDYSAACVIGSDIYVIGGRNETGQAQSNTYRFNTEANEWSMLAPMPEAKCLHNVCVVDNLIYVMGGSSIDCLLLTSVHRFDPVQNLWSVLAPMSVARATGFGTFVLDGSIYAVGGQNGVPSRYGPPRTYSSPTEKVTSAFTSMERYCSASDSWSEVNGGELGTARCALRGLAMHCDHQMGLFDNLIAKAARV
jgi:hypothetical protein